MNNEALIALITAVSTVLVNVLFTWKAIAVARMTQKEAKASAKRAEIAADQAMDTINVMKTMSEKAQSS